MTTTRRDAPRRLAVGIDGSPTSRAAVRWAIDYAREGDTVTLVHAWQASPAHTELGFARDDDAIVAQRFAAHELAHAKALAHDAGVTLECEALQGDPKDCLRHVEADLLVVGARGHCEIAGLLLGSVSTHLSHHAHKPLVIVPFQSRESEDTS